MIACAACRSDLEFASVDLISGYGLVFRLMRERAGLTRVDLAERAGVSDGTLGRIEREVGPPTIETLAQSLHAMGVTLIDFAVALERHRHGGTAQVPGRARLEWVGLFRRNGVDARVLTGAALAALTDPDAAADLVASAILAARELAEEAVAEVRRAELSLVAEATSDYDAGKGKR